MFRYMNKIVHEDHAETVMVMEYPSINQAKRANRGNLTPCVDNKKEYNARLHNRAILLEKMKLQPRTAE